MRRQILNWLVIALACTMVSTPMAMMALFLGSQSRDLYALLLLQLLLAVLSCLIAAFLLVSVATRVGSAHTLRSLWQHIPGWMVFVVLSANSLVLIAEMSLLLLNVLSDETRPWFEHVPVVTALCSSVALALTYGYRRLVQEWR